MNSRAKNFTAFLEEEKNNNKLIIFLLLLICFFKVPGLLTSDIQPWDEGMYAVRVLSIHTFNDFFDQVNHSVAGFISGSHPPILIWLGYASTLVFGINEFSLKLIPFIFTLLCVLMIIKTGKELNSFNIGYLAALIFSGTYLFTIYSKRFQFDIPVTFFIITSFYYFFVFIKNQEKKTLILSGIFFGLSMMTKALVGLYIPAVLFVSYFLIKNKIKVQFSDIIILTSIGIAIALPWHLYMILKHGDEFTGFLFGFHLVSRALGNHSGIKPQKFYFFLNILVNNIPFGIIIFISLIKDIKNFVRIDSRKIILWVWFLSGFISISIFRTKLETYIIPFLAPAILLLVIYLIKEQKSLYEKITVILLTILNTAWLFTAFARNDLKEYFFHMSLPGIILTVITFIAIIIILFFVLKSYADKINFNFAFTTLILFFFVFLNLYYTIEIPAAENSYVLSEIKNEVEKGGRKKIIYISTDFEYNPQFTFYFNGIDLGWKNKLSYEIIELKDGLINAKTRLEALPYGEYTVIVERENINPGFYHESKLFMPERFKLIKKHRGYEMYSD